MPKAAANFPPTPGSAELAQQIAETFQPHGPVDASIIIPVNAQGDLENVLKVCGDLCRYAGSCRLELILVVNNFDEATPPSEIDLFRAWGLRVEAIPSVRRPGEAVGFSARIPGIRIARSPVCILFDADVRIPNATRLIDWYVRAFASGAKAAYTHVAHYDVEPGLSLRISFAIHHLARWIKRRALGIPTTRGSNYAVDREVMLELYDARMLADEMNVGPTFKRQGHLVAYNSARELYVYTSGRMFRPGWRKMIAYFWYRLRYNLRTLPVRRNVSQFTGRESDPVRRYIDNRPIQNGNEK